jgi:hypothetical protein
MTDQDAPLTEGHSWHHQFPDREHLDGARGIPFPPRLREDPVMEACWRELEEKTALFARLRAEFLEREYPRDVARMRAAGCWAEYLRNQGLLATEAEYLECQLGTRLSEIANVGDRARAALLIPARVLSYEILHSKP